MVSMSVSAIPKTITTGNGSASALNSRLAIRPGSSAGRMPVSADYEIENSLKRASEQNQQYLQEAKELYQPYADAGLSSLDEYMKLLMGGVDGLKDDQNFQNLQDLAERKVMANRATSGLLRSGATASALDDAILNFANQYYGNRLAQFREGVNLGANTTSSQASILEKMGVGATDLATALANVKMTREGMANELSAANTTAAANKYAAENTGGLFGHGGFLGLGI